MSETRESSPSRARPATSRWPLASDGMTVAFASALAYVTAFVYQAGEAAYYRIPSRLIAVDLTQAFVAAVVLYSSLAGVAILVNLLSIVWRRAPKPLQGRLRTVVFFTVAALVPLTIIRDYRHWWTVLAAFVLTVAGELLLPLTNTQVHGYLNKVEAANEFDRKSAAEGTSLYQDMIRRWPKAVGTVLLAVVLLSAAWAAGLAQSRRQIDYLVWAGEPERVAVIVSSSRMVFADFDREDGKVGNHLTIVGVPTGEGQILTLEPIGPLSVEAPSE